MMSNISILPFKFKHMPLLLEILKSQKYMGIHHITMRTLPKIGYICLLNGQPIAAGFLRRVEPCYAQLDTLCSNAYFGSLIRHEGVSKIVDELLADAQRLKLEGVLASTSDKGILARAQHIGFHLVNEQLIAIPIT